MRLCLAEKGFAWTGHHLNLRRFDQLKPEFFALNPAGLVPVLVDGGQVLTESRIINEYLEDAYPQPRLCPKGAYARARMRLWTRYADEVAAEAVKLPSFVNNIQPELQRMPRAEALAAIERIGEQIYWLLHGEALHQELVTDADLRSYFAALNRKYARGSKRIYFVVDGLEDSALTAEVGSYLKICDQYFGVNDLELIRFVRSLKPDCKIVIVTSKKQQPKGEDLEEVYSREWTHSISPRLPGGCEIVIVGIEGSGESPIHDRWWITENSGLRLGTSYNSMGISKASEIAVLHEGEIAEREAKVDSLIQRTTKEHKGGGLASQYLIYERWINHDWTC